MKVLLVDDEVDILEQAKIFLQKEIKGLNVETVTSSQRALNFLEENSFDAVVSDYQMPGMEGLEFLRILREERGSDVPFIIFTGKGREDVVVEALNLGANRYLQKGSDPKSQFYELAHAVKQEVEHYRSREKLRDSEERYRKTVENANFGVAVLGADEGVKLINSEMRELTGLQKKNIPHLYTRLRKLLHSDAEREKIPGAEVEIALEGGRGDGKEVRFVNDDVGSRVLLFEEFELESEEVLLTAKDITEKKEIEKLLQNKSPSSENRNTVSKEKKNVVGKEPIVQKDENEQFKPPKKVRNRLEAVEGKIGDLISFQSTYTKRMLKFGIASWVFSISIFFTLLIFYKGPEVFLDAPPISVSLLTGAIAAPIAITAVFLRKKGGKVKDLEKIKSNLLDQYEKALILSQKREMKERKEYLHSLLRHDVRNKAQVVQGYHELLKDLDLPEEAEEYVEKASKTVKDSIDLVEKVRTLRKLGAEEKVEEIDIGKMIKNVIREKEPQASEKGIEIQHRNSNFKVKGGPFLEEMFSNLLENSIIHSECEKIRITSQEQGQEVTVTVEDDGKGLPDEDKEKIFEKGYKKGEEAGSGLGLYLVKKIAESYDGSVEVKNSELGGVRFDLHLDKV